MYSFRTASLVFLAISACAWAQSNSAPRTHAVMYYDGPDGRSFALVQDRDVMVNGSWRNGDELQSYAHTHPGHYIVFLDGSTLRRLDAPDALAEAEQAYAPMVPLNARQTELAAEQKPLAAQQHELSRQQHDASGNPSEQARIGQEQGRVGQQQGEIGRKQGEVGRQQGEVGRAFYSKVQGLLNECLQKGSCPAVSGS